MTGYSGGLLFLVGPSGVGKTTVGRALARRLAVDFFDSDHEIEDRCGCAISLIFEVEGEAGFRVRETQVLRDLCLRSSGICSTGGGIVLAEQNRQLMRAHGTVVYLHAPPAVLHSRTRGDKTRPLLQTVDPRTAIEAMYAKRDVLYRDVADLVVEASTPGAALAAEEIVRRLRPAEP